MADIALGAAPARRNFDGFWILPPLIVLALLFFYPLALIIRASLGDGPPSLATFEQVLASRQFIDGLYHTVVIAIFSTIGCLVLGFVLSVVFAFVPFPGAKLASRLIDTVIALPTFLVTLAFTFIYGSAGILNETLMHAFALQLPPIDFLYSQWGVVLAEVTVYIPLRDASAPRHLLPDRPCSDRGGKQPGSAPPAHRAEGHLPCRAAGPGRRGEPVPAAYRQ